MFPGLKLIILYRNVHPNDPIKNDFQDQNKRPNLATKFKKKKIRTIFDKLTWVQRTCWVGKTWDPSPKFFFDNGRP